MSFGPDLGGARLAYVAREVKGTIETTQTRFKSDKNGGHNEQTVVEVKDPVIVFFPNRSVRVMPLKEADRLGFLKQPTVLNFEAVTDQNSVAGRFKFAINDSARHDAWKQMEQSIIANCQRKGGRPLPDGVTFSSDSIYLTSKEVA